MIEKMYGSYEIVCDICNVSTFEEFNNFQDAVDSKSECGFKSKKYANGWKDICECCQVD